MHLNVELVAEKLWAVPKLAQQYGLSDSFTSPTAFVEALLGQIGQAPTSAGQRRALSTSDVFKAAVMSLASVSGTWASFLTRRPSLERLLHNYDPAAVVEEAQSPSYRDDLTGLLPGQSQRQNAAAVVRWAELLTALPNYNEVILRLADALRAHAMSRGIQLTDRELFVCLYALFGEPQRTPFEDAISDLGFDLRRLPGMRYALAAEFLRNLGWDGFKPDRHVVRLLGGWLGTNVDELDTHGQELAQLVRRSTRSQEFRTSIAYGLAALDLVEGSELNGRQLSASEVDNLIWLIGANVEKKNRTVVEKSYLIE